MTEALKIKEIAHLAGKQNGCRIYDIYKHKDRLQIFIDKKPKNKTVNLEDCENVFHSLQFLLHSELPHILENRRLEVSSPGVEKQLREKWHFEESIGETVKLITNSPLEAQNAKTGKNIQIRSLTGCLTSVSENQLNLKYCSAECPVPFSKIKSARLIFQPPKKSPKKTNKKTR